jgi:beta-N-acetylhexosaminidase
LAALENGPAVVVVSFGSPYFLRDFPGVDAYLCLYRNTPETQDIAARALAGEMDIGGKLPVSIPDIYPVGHGIALKKRIP